MKRLWTLSVIFALSCFIRVDCEASDASLAGGSARVLERGKSFTVIESTRRGTNQFITKTNRYTTIGNGMNFRDASGNWLESKPVVRSFAEGIVCSGASYRAIISTNLNAAGAIDLQTCDGQRIVSHPLSIGFFDPASGKSVLLAQVKDCPAEVISNKIIFRDAFEGSGIDAAVTYTYGVGRFHQDVTFVKRPAVTPADFGLGSKTRLELMTEIVQSPTPEVTEHVLTAETNAALRADMVEPDVVDRTLTFGEMMMPLGRAFLNGTPAPAQRGLPVAKRLLNIDGRTVLTESLEWTAAKAELDQLPLASVSGFKTKDLAAIKRQLPARRVAQRGQSFETRLAEITRSRSTALAGLGGRQSSRNSELEPHESPLGFVMDYELLESIDGFTFLSGTYYLPSSVSIHTCSFYSYSQIIFKYGHFSSLNLSGSIGSYPGCTNVFTSVDDDTIGDTIEGSTGSPDGYYAAYALGIESPYDESVNFDALDFRYAYGGLHVDNAEGYYVSVGLSCFTNTSLGVDAGSVAQIALTEVRACHVGTLYQEDNGGTVVIGSVVTCPDSDGDGLPDAWEMANFGTLAYSQNGDYDGDGVSNSDEYSFGTDPNTISFVLVVNSQYVNFTSVPVQLDVTGGVPSSQAILVDSTNFAGATWTAYTSSNLTVTLPATEGWHEVWVGLRGRLATSEQTWQWRRFKLDQTPPAVVVTNPPSTVTQPMIQLQGYSPEALSAISCDVSNALGVFSDQVILVLDSHYDTNTYEFTTNTFQGFDLRLASGVNTITIQATDLAGNLTTTNFNFTLVSNSIAPLVQLWWPQDGAQLMGDTFTWRGLVDDFTAGLTATVVDASGNTNVSSATVERDGKFWFEDLPLADGASTVTLTAVDYWGNITTTNISVTKSSVELTIDPIDENELDETPITVTGTINVSNHAVWVNGVRATLNGDDTWRAENVPLPPGGTAVFQARAIPDTDHEGNGDPGSGSGGASASMQNPGNPTSPQQKDKGKEQDEQARIYIDKDDVNSQHSDRKVRFDYFDGSGSPDGWNTMEVWDDYEQHWTHDLQKAEKGHGTGKKDHHEHYEYSTGLPVTYNPCPSTFVWPVTGAPNSADLTSCDNSHHAIAAPPLASEHCEVNNPPPASGDFWNLFEPPYFHSHWNYISYTRKAQTKWKVFTGGKTKSARDALWRFGGTAAEVLDKRAQRPFTATRSIDNSQIKVFGKTLPSDGIIFKTLPNGQYMDVPVEVTGAGGDFYTFTPSGIRHDLTNAYECPIGNADERDVGVGEIVGYAFNPPLPQNSPAAWGVDGGALSGSTGNSTTYTATDTQTSAAYVKATVRGETIIDVFDVLVPSGAHAETLSKTRYDIEKAGAGMNLRVILEPTSVSFHWIQVFEVGQPATGTSGYFVDHPPPAHDTDHRANQWYPVDCSNVIGNGFDSAYSPQYNSWYEGQFTWEIPVKWKVAGGQEHTLMSQWDQVFHLYNDGTMTVTKFNHTVTRHTNQEYGAVVPDP